MTALGLLLALLLTWWSAWTWLRLLVPRGIAGERAVLAGYSLLGGLLLVPLLMRLLDFAGIGLHFSSIAIAALLAGAGGALAGRWIPRALIAAEPAGAPLPRWQRLLIGLLLALLLLRLLLLGIEVIWRPVFPWDATMHWTTKAKVWLEHGALLPFVSQDEWLARGGSGVFTDHHPGYPRTIPLLQVWAGLAAGGYHPSLINLSWLAMYIAMGLAFYGQARNAGLSPLLATAGCYLLLSMPLLNTHVALAGYADLMLGACYLLALMALHCAATLPGQRLGQGLLALLFALGCLLVKNEGLFWGASLLAAALVLALPRRLQWRAVAAGAVLVAALLWLWPRDLVVAGHSLAQLRIHFRPEVLPGLFDSLFVFSSWHLLPWLLALLLPAYWLGGGRQRQQLTAIGLALTFATLLFLFLFLFTHYAVGVQRHTAVGRISLHLLPAVSFLGLLLYNACLGSSQDEVTGRQNA